MYNKRPKELLCILKSPVPEGKTESMGAIDEYIKNHKSGFSSEDIRKAVFNKIPIETALKEWLDTQKNEETKRKYKRAVEKLFPSITLIELNSSITCLEKESCEGIYNRIKNEWDAPYSTKELCTTAYARFCDYVRTSTYGFIDPEIGLREQVSFHKAEDIYNDIDWELLLDTIEMPYRLICKMLYIAARLCQYRLRISDRYKNVLSLTTEQVKFKENTISFKEEQSYHALGLTITFPLAFMQELKSYLGQRDGLIFLPEDAQKFFPNQVERALKKAARKLEYSEQITPVILSWAGVITNKVEYEEACRKANPSLYR
jgi:hypothetical protein